MENTTTVQNGEAEKAPKERTYSLTLKQIEALGKNKAWLTAFRETAEALPVLTAAQVYKHTAPKV